MSTLCSDLSQIELAYSVAEQQMAKRSIAISLLDSELASMCVVLLTYILYDCSVMLNRRRGVVLSVIQVMQSPGSCR